MKKYFVVLIILGVILAGGFILKFVGENYFKIEVHEPLGCGGVALEYIDGCCERWANENEIVNIQCVGNWTVVDGVCSWKCN